MVVVVVVVMVVMVVVVVYLSLLGCVADQSSGGYRNELSRQDSFFIFCLFLIWILLFCYNNVPTPPPVMQLDARLEVELTSFGLVELGSLLGLVPKKSGSHEGTSTDIGARQGPGIWGRKGKKPSG